MEKKFECKLCRYKTNSNKDYAKHQTTQKHKNAVANPERALQVVENTNAFPCVYCNKLFRNRVTLWRHRPKCDKKINVIEEVKPEPEQNLSNEFMMKMLKQNEEIHKSILEQQKVFIEQSNKLIEISSKPSTTLIQNNLTTNNTTNNNNSFNLNVFLNEQCKDAISITDFVDSLNLNVSDLEATGKLGYVLGISRIFINKLKELDIYERPLHCTDYKRETVYIKNQDSWEKDNQEKTKLRHLVSRIARKNLEQLPAWQQENPDYVTLDTPENNEFLKISLSSLGGYSNEEENKHVDKIMRNVLKEVVVSKNSLVEM